MAQELNLDQLSTAVRRQQEGQTNGKQLAWDPKTMSFVELGRNEQLDENMSLINDVSSRPFFFNRNGKRLCKARFLYRWR